MADKKQRPIDLLLDRLAGQKLQSKGGKYKCLCPSHDDKDPSLHFGEDHEGNAWVKCWAHKCTTDQILASIGLERKHLFSASIQHHYGRPFKGTKDKGWKDKTTGANWVHICDYAYTDEDGKVLYWKSRFDLDNGSGKKLFQYWYEDSGRRKVKGIKAGWYEETRFRTWEYISDGPPDIDPPTFHARYFEAPRMVLYLLHLLMQDIRDQVSEVYLPEGEKDAKALRTLGVSSTSAPNGSGHWLPEFTEVLSLVKRVVIVADADESGMKSAILKREALNAMDVPNIVVVCGDFKDPAALIAAGGAIQDMREVDPEVELARYKAIAKLAKSMQPGEATPAPPSPQYKEPTLHSLHQLDSWDFPTTDIENTKVFADYVADDLKYCAGIGKFLEWRGTHYEVDKTGGEPMLRRYKKFASDLRSQAIGTFGDIPKGDEDYGRAESVLRNANRVQNINAIKAVDVLVRKTRPIPVTTDQFNKQIDMLPVLNGTINLRTGQLIDSDPKHLFTHCAPVKYDPDADCPEFVKFLDSCLMGDREMFKYLQLVTGYSLTGHSTEKSIYFFYGPGDSGKSTFMRAIMQLVGSFYQDLDKTHVMMKDRTPSDIQEHIVRLEGKRIVTVIEVGSQDRWNEPQLKKWTGDEEITARAPFEESRTFHASFKLWASGNERPAARDQSNAFWNRLKPIHFPRTFLREEQDENLKHKLKAESSGILNWILAGAAEWYLTPKIVMPYSVTSELEKYREDLDVIGRFIREATEDVPEGTPVEYRHTKAVELYEAFCKWAKFTGTYAMQSKRFYQEIGKRTDVRYVRRGTGNLLLDRRMLLHEDYRIGMTDDDFDGAPESHEVQGETS